MSTIQAAVSSKILSKVDRLFSNKLSDIFIELLQNARRAGATLVDVTTEEIEQGTRITFADDGEGIADFSVLLHLGDSDWAPSTSDKEDPAGMGFFSLLHSGVIVTSRGKQAVIRKAGFLGQKPVEVLEADGPYKGTVLVFVRTEKASGVRETLLEAARYGNLEVKLDGVRVPREDFLKDALLVKQVSGVRIGVYSHYARAAWNFHGRVLEGVRNLPHLSQVTIDPHGGRGDLYVRVDVQEARYIHLKLPDRTDIVEDENHTALCREARVAMYEYLASLPEHAAYYSHFLEARKLGVFLKEASPWFRTFYEDPSWEGDDEDFFTGRRAVLVNASDHAIVDRKDGSADFLAFTFLIALEHSQALLPVQPIEDTTGYEGYSWYGAIPRIRGFRLFVDGKEVGENDGFGSLLTLSDSIQLSFVLERNGAQETVGWDIPFAAFKNGDWCEEFSLVVSRSSPWASAQGTMRPFDLVDAAVYLAFSPSDDYEADSTETQLQDFRDNARSAIIRTLGGTLAQIRYALDEALSDWKYNVLGFLRETNISEIHLRRNQDGKWDSEFIPSPTASE